jgi:hypothetical protein
MNRRSPYLLVIIIVGLTAGCGKLWNPAFNEISWDGYSYSGGGENGPGFGCGITIWESREGELVHESLRTYSSPDDARKALERELKSRGTIIERKQSPEAGREIYERVVIRSNRTESEPATLAIISLQNNQLHFVEASTLESALEFERFRSSWW